MEVVRTFHPIGQGAFYSERFYMQDQQGTVHNIVYDCGVQWGFKGKVEHVVTQAFTQADTIDYLFISHLDYDHVSLVKKLLSCVKAVRNIVLPLITEEQLVIALAFHRISGHENMVHFFNTIINHLRGGGDDYNGGDYTLYLVSGPDEANLNVVKAKIWQNGKERATQWDPEWIFKPYNVAYRAHKQDLKVKLATLLSKSAFKTALQNIGESPLQSADELYERLKEETFVGKVLSNNVLRSLLKKAYESIPGGTNENSLLLYSGPVRDELNYVLNGCQPYCMWCQRWWPGRFYKAGCLYTGDSSADMMGWKNKIYTAVWDCIGTIQLPHHGSVESFDVTQNPIDRPYIVPVSCGSCNNYGHPSGKVLAYLMTNQCCIQIVTENANTVFIERIVKR